MIWKIEQEIMLGKPSDTNIEVGNERPTFTDRVYGTAEQAANARRKLGDRIYRLENL